MERSRKQQVVKKRKRITATSDSDSDEQKTKKTNDQNHPINKAGIHSSDVEIMNSSISMTPKPSVEPQPRSNSTSIDHTRRTTSQNGPPSSNLSSSPSTNPALNQTTESIPDQSELLNQTLKNNFKFLILKGPEFFSNHQALSKMVESAQTFLEEEPDEAIYQLELDEKSSQLKHSESSLDIELNTIVTPVVQILTQFVQAHVERELKLKFNQAIKAHTIRQEKKFDKQLEKLISKPSSDHTSSFLSSSSVTEKVEKIETGLAALTARIDNLSSKMDRKLEEFEKSAQSQAEISSKQIHQLQTKLKEIGQTDKTHPEQPQTKDRSVEAEVNSTGNSLKLHLSPQVTTAQPQPSHRSSSQSQSQPQSQSQFKPTHSSLGDPSQSPVNPVTRNPKPPQPLKIPNRLSVEPGASSPRTSSTLPSTDHPLPSDSPLNTNHQSINQPISAEAYNYISTRLMKSSWLLDYSKSKLTECYKHYIHQDLTTHLDQLGLTPQRISELLNLLNLLPNLDLNFLSKKPSPSILTPTPPGNNPTTHCHSQQLTPIITSNNSKPLHPPANLPTNYNLVENFSLPYLKDILGVIQYNAQYLKGRLDRFEIRLANAEKIGIDDHPHLLNLIKRMEFVEVQTALLIASRATSEELLALTDQIETRISLVQFETKKSLEEVWEKMTSKIQSPRHHAPPSAPLVPPGHPQASSTAKKANKSRQLMLNFENHILDRLFAELGRFMAHPGSSTSNDTTPKEGKSKPTDCPRRELEEGETGGEEEQGEHPDTINSLPTEDRTTHSSKWVEPSTRWKKLIEILNSKYQEQQRKQGKEVLVYEHQHHHHQHHHHHHRVRMVLGVTEPSSINCLKIEKQVEHAEVIQSAEQLALERHHEELEALAQNTCPNPIPFTSTSTQSALPNTSDPTSA